VFSLSLSPPLISLLRRTCDVLPFRRRTITARGGGGGVVLENEFLQTQRGRGAPRETEPRHKKRTDRELNSLLLSLFSLVDVV
jgi:hypothetical protein